ncbi:HlyD family efflux transporter periplasmic adaptor subunit [Massilia solisilvae]|uniref:HlyD family efflux transporter periplasmic adaptor subunit n=1 Tax=Massilia solisilvae TaxID=1811225 RepID=A0ABT2BE43_9BURK|nr:HlyD family efflux transporter periplasmic adaptor subunit [Massilia solisilvae]MCS0606778.1 HlyD family efflux transporter periplasmic adaptor subunit [Massilia solisilvae]
MSSTLFRKAAIEKCQTKWLGEVILVQPLSLSVLTSTAIAMALAVIGFLALTDYTKRTSVAGQLAPDRGVITVYSPQPGIVEKKLIKEGQLIKKGETLYIVSTEHQSGLLEKVHATVSQQLLFRKQLLRDEITHTLMLHEREKSALRKKIAWSQVQETKISHQIADQLIRVALAEAGTERTSRLLSQGFVSADLAQQKQADLLDQRNRLAALERDKLTAQQDLEEQQSALDSLPLRQQNDIAQLERVLVSTDQELTESEGKRTVVILAPEDGVATAVLGEVGQTVDSGRPLASIVPKGAKFVAQLYAPSSAIGFVRPQDKVLLRFHSYPYQKFGHAVGSIVSVSKTTLASRDVTGFAGSDGKEGPVYLITVALARQTIMAYGKPQPLQAGMLVDADVFQEKRKLYEWVLDPLYSLSGKF